jgi:hypothetical protein
MVLKPSRDPRLKSNIPSFTKSLSEYEEDLIEYYTPLSNVWGNEKVTEKIAVDVKDFGVTANLESALCHLGDLTRKQIVWADAVCIN